MKYVTLECKSEMKINHKILWASTVILHTTSSWSNFRRIFSNNWFSSWASFVCLCQEKINSPGQIKLKKDDSIKRTCKIKKLSMLYWFGIVIVLVGMHIIIHPKMEDLHILKCQEINTTKCNCHSFSSSIYIYIYSYLTIKEKSIWRSISDIEVENFDYQAKEEQCNWGFFQRPLWGPEWGSFQNYDPPKPILRKDSIPSNLPETLSASYHDTL